MFSRGLLHHRMVRGWVMGVWTSQSELDSYDITELSSLMRPLLHSVVPDGNIILQLRAVPKATGSFTTWKLKRNLSCFMLLAVGSLDLPMMPPLCSGRGIQSSFGSSSSVSNQTASVHAFHTGTMYLLDWRIKWPEIWAVHRCQRKAEALQWSRSLETSVQQMDGITKFFITVVQGNKSKGSCCFKSFKKFVKFYRCSQANMLKQIIILLMLVGFFF